MTVAMNVMKTNVTAKDRICSPNLGTNRTTCGRRITRQTRTDTWDKVTCRDCHAAARAGG